MLNALKNEFFIGGATYLIFAAGVFYLGSLFEIDMTMRILISVVILLIMALIMMYRKMKANRDAAKLEAGMKAQADAALFGQVSDKRLEIEELQKKFVAAIETLKQSKLGKGGKGNQALYSLPWYMLIGPPAAGKTTLIQNSGLQFPLDTSRVRGVGGTRDCDWFFSTSAIFLDTAGRYTTEQTDEPEWLGFLDLLKKYRKKKPLNGVIVSLAVTDLMGRPEEVEQHAATIRRRLDELISRLGVHFPVYLIFTKTDLVEGCVEFFSDLNAREVEQIWGHTLDELEQAQREPGQIFRATYNRILKTLEDLRLSRLNTNLKREDRRKVYSFPDEMTGLKDPITMFVNRLFQYNPFNENPIFRGYYFTSGTQEGTPIDRVMQALATQYSLPQTGGELPTQRQAKSYFIKDIFNHVVIPDQLMAVHTKAEKKLKNKLQIGSIALAVVTMLLFFWGVGCGYSKSRQTLANLDDALIKAKSVAWSGPEKTIPNLQILDNLRLRIKEAENESFFWTMGMTRGESAAEQARLLFFQKFKPLVEQQFYRNMESGLREYVTSGQDPIGKMEEQLGAYILMGSDVNFAQGTEPPTKAEGVKHLQAFLVYAADLQFNNPSSGGMKLSKEIQTMVKEQVKLFGRVVRENEPLRFRTDQTLIRQSRELLRKNLSAKSIYHSIKRQIINQTPRLGSIGLPELVGPIASGYMFGSVRVNGFFTRSAWDTLVVREFKKRSENPVAGNWIIGPLSKAQLPSNLTSPTQYLSSLVRFYFEDYARSWVTFVQGITYDRSGVSSSNPLSVAMRLNQLSAAGSSPYQALVDSVSSQNRLTFKQEKGGNIVTNTWDSIMGNERMDIQVDQAALDIGQSIKAIHALSNLPPPGGKGTNGGLKTLLDAYFAVSKEVERMASGQQAPMAEQSINSAKDVAERLSGLFDSGTGARMKALFQAPLEDISSGVVVIQQEQVAQTFSASVGGELATVQGRYPFNEGASADLSADEFGDLFKPGGKLDQFFEQNKAMIENPNSGAKGAELKTFRDKVREIQKSFFAGGSLSAQFDMVPDRPEPSNVVAEVDLKMDATLHNNRTSEGFSFESPKRVVWPGDGGEAYIEIRDVNGNSARVAAPRGAFAMFRLLEKGSLKARSSDEFEVEWGIKLGGKSVRLRYTIQAAGLKNPIAGLNLLHDLKMPDM